MKRAVRRWGGQAVRRMLVLFFCLTPAVVHAQTLDTAAVTQRVKEISVQLRCPVCQGLSIEESQSELSAQMRSLIRDQVIAGKSDEDILNYFVTKYGEWILLAPPAHGFNLAVYILPFVMLFGGMAILWVSVKRWTAQPKVTESAHTA